MVAPRPGWQPGRSTRFMSYRQRCSLAFVIGNVVRGRHGNGRGRWPAAGCLLVLAHVCMALLVLLSLSFDFGNCPYPSREWPYFSSGRLMLGALVPFLIMYLGGLEVVLRWLRLSWARVPALMIFAGFMATSQLALSIDVFASQFNWFHLR